MQVTLWIYNFVQNSERTNVIRSTNKTPKKRAEVCTVYANFYKETFQLNSVTMPKPLFNI